MYNKLRQEYNKQSFKKYLKTNLGCKCRICGSEENIEYHHIIALAVGGDNSLSNIIPLCYECHQKAHRTRNVRKYCAERSDNYGRPSPLTYEQAEPILEQYFLCKIGAKECWKKLGYTGKVKLAGKKHYKRYKDEHGIIQSRNNIDLIASQPSKKNSKRNTDTEEIFNELEGRVVGYIKYNSGKTEVLIYSPQE